MILKHYIMSKFRVYYGWARINKIRKREAISVIFENCQQNKEHAERFIKRMQDTVYVRFQTEEESKDAEGINRMYTEFSIFMDHKNIRGSLNAALTENYIADSNHVPENIRDEIRKKLHTTFISSHLSYKEPAESVNQLTDNKPNSK